MCPDWVPSMDVGQRFARITVKTIAVHGFDHRASRVAKVRNVSRLRSQYQSPIFNVAPTRRAVYGTCAPVAY